MNNSHYKKILIVPGTEFLGAYSGTRYLIENLQSAGVPVKVWIRCSKEDFNEYSKLPFSCSIFLKKTTGYYVLRRLSSLIFRILVFFKMLSARRVLITESTYLREAALVKKIKGRFFILIQFCQELHTPEEYPGLEIATRYERFAQVPDMVIDVEPNRAKIRMERFGLKKLPAVLYNTIPLNSLPMKAPEGTLASLAGLTSFNNLPILLHMGGIGAEKPLDRIIDAIAFSKSTVFFLAFCNGPSEKIETLRAYAESKLVTGRFRILQALPREILLASAWEADIGIIDYTYSVQPSSNQKFCAPSKLYEFLALELAVLCSSNKSLKDIVEKEKIGICAKGDLIEDLGEALRNLLSVPKDLLTMKKRARKVFVEKYSYEKLCLSVLNEKIVKQMYK